MASATAGVSPSPTLERFGVVIAFIALFAYNAITQPDTFLKPENLRNLLNQNADIGVIAVGMTLVIIAGGIDLSVGAVMAFGAAVGMLTMNALFEGGQQRGPLGGGGTRDRHRPGSRLWAPQRPAGDPGQASPRSS